MIENDEELTEFDKLNQVGIISEQSDLKAEAINKYWKRRAKIKWDSWGDKCTRFFFLKAKARTKRNEITALRKVTGEWAYI